MLPRTTYLLIAHVSLLTFADVNFTVSSCVDPSGYDSCLSTANSNINNCVRKNCGNAGTCYNAESCFFNDPDCEQACGCEAYTEWINCALSFCWNQAYSCAYQALAVNGFATCGALAKAYPPYFPPPANAPGGCSCNFGAVYSSILEYTVLSNRCASLGLNFEFDCQCCSYSGALSALPDTCPDTDPASIPGWHENVLADEGIAGCALNLETATCTASPLNFPTPTQAVTPKFYLPDAIPTGGSVAISDTPGSLSRPISGDVLTWSIAKEFPTVATAASYTNSDGGAQSKGSSSNGACSSPLGVSRMMSMAVLVGTVMVYLA